MSAIQLTMDDEIEMVAKELNKSLNIVLLSKLHQRNLDEKTLVM